MVLSAPAEGAGLVLGGEDAGAFEGDVHLQLGMRQVGRIALGRDLDLARADVDPVFARSHRAGEATVHRVIAEQVGVGLDRTQIVDRHHFDVRAAVLNDRAKDETADAAETIDGDANGHGEAPLNDYVVGVSMELSRPGFNPAAAP